MTLSKETIGKLADAIAQEYICNGEVEDDNYKWLYVNYQFEAN